MPTDGAAGRPRQHYGVTFAVLALGALAYTILQSMVLPALPTLQHDLHTTESTVAWVLTAYLLSASVATPIVGRLGDIYGKERMLIVVFAVLSAGTLLAALSTTITVLIVARVIQGIGGAVFPLAFGIIRDEFPEDKVAGGLGLISTILGVGSGLGIVLGGPIVQRLSYHWLFWIPLVMALLALVAAIFFIPESPVRTPGRLNYTAAVLMSGWLLALLVDVTEAPVWGWTSARTMGLFAVAVVLFLAWIRSELRSDEPLVDMRMMRIPTVWWTNVAAFLFGVGMYSTIVVIPPFLQTARSAGYGFSASPTVSGLYLAPSAAAMLVIGLFVGRITNRWGSKLPLIAGGVLAAAPFLLLAFSHDAPWEFLLATTMSGFGVGLAFAAMPNLIVDSVPDTQTGIATGMNATIRTIGGSIGSQVVAAIIATGVVVGGVTHVTNYSVSFAVLGGSFLLAGLAAAMVPSGRRAPSLPGIAPAARFRLAKAPGEPVSAR